MPSKTEPQARLMAACSHGAAYQSCPPLKVAREFNQADKRTGILKKKARGGHLQGAIDAHMHFGQGHGRGMTSTMPLMGHALSGTPLGGDRGSARKAPHLYSLRLAEGGKVEKPNGPSAKERRDIRDMIEHGRQDALDTLRRSRSALLQMMPAPPSASPDYSDALDRLQSSLNMQDGGSVSPDEPGDSDSQSDASSGDPSALYQEYMDLLAKLQDPQLEGTMQMELVDRLSQIESALESMGIDVAQNAGAGTADSSGG